MIQPFAESGSKSLQESFASVGGVAYVASGTGICRTVAGSGLTRVESRSRWNIPGKCNRLSLTEGIGCGGAVGTTVGRRSRARYGRTLHVTFATARPGRAAAGEFRNRTNEGVIRGSVCLFRRGRLLVQRRGSPWHHAAGTGPNRPVAVAGVELARGRTGGTRFRRARDR